MSASHRLLAVIAALLPALAGPPAGAADTPWQEPLWVHPPGWSAAVPTLLTLPAGWLRGDAAIVLVPDGRHPDPLRDRVAEALLDADAAVEELDPEAAAALLPGVSVPLLAGPPARDALLAEALRALRAEVGAGLLVVVGLRGAGDAALAAAGASGPAPAAAVALGDGAARFRAGARPAAAEQWDRRAPLLCGVLAGLAGGEEARRRCLAALLGEPGPDGVPLQQARGGRAWARRIRISRT